MGGGIFDHLSEQTKHLLDRASYCLAGLTGAMSYATIYDALNMALVVIGVLSGLVSLSWGIYRWRKELRGKGE